MGKLLAQIEKVKMDMKQQETDLTEQLIAQQIKSKKSISDLQTTVEAEIIRRVKVKLR